MKLILSELIQKLHAFAKEKQLNQAVLGLSGGLDSAVALCIAVRAFGPKNVTALILPELGITPNEDIEHAKKLAEHFGCKWHYQPINNLLVDFNFIPWGKSPEAYAGIKSRVRSTLLRHFAEVHQALFVSAANQSDLSLQFGSQQGELDGDYYLLGDLYKTEVIELAKQIGMPKEMFEKQASRQLSLHQNDNSELSGSWLLIDDILKQLELGTDPEQMIQKGMDPLLIHKIMRLKQEATNHRPHAPVAKVKQIGESIKKARAAEEASSKA